MSNPIVLQTPIIRGDITHSQITITETMRQAGSLRGLKLLDVMNSDVDSLIVLLPRVTSPALTSVEVATLDVWDFAQLALGIADFLQPSSATDKTVADLPVAPLSKSK